MMRMAAVPKTYGQSAPLPTYWFCWAAQPSLPSCLSGQSTRRAEVPLQYCSSFAFWSAPRQLSAGQHFSCDRSAAGPCQPLATGLASHSSSRLWSRFYCRQHLSHSLIWLAWALCYITAQPSAAQRSADTHVPFCSAVGSCIEAEERARRLCECAAEELEVAAAGARRG